MSKLALITLFALFTVLMACKSTKSNSGSNTGTTTTIDKKAFIPHSVGTFWVYEYVDHQNPEGTVFVDTLKVMAHEKSEEGLKIILNQAKWIVKGGGDSIFVYCQGRGGGGFAMPMFHRTITATTYGSCKGDVVMQVTVSKLYEPVIVKGRTYKNCYQYDMKPYEKIIVAEGVGVIKKEFYGVNNKLATEQLLINHAVK